MIMIGPYEMKKYSLDCLNVDHLSNAPHLHAEWEAIICFSGSTVVHMNDASFELEPNKIVLVSPYSFHFYEENPGDYIVMCFGTDIMPILKKQFAKERPKKNIIDFSADKVLYDTVMQFKKLFSTSYAEGDRIDLTIGLSYVNLIMLFAKPLFEFVPIDYENANISRRVMDYCMENYKQDVSLEILSKALGYSKSYISHIFNLDMQMSITTFVNWMRISEACNLLRSSPESVTDIAHEVGFGSLRAFNRTFLSFMSQSPSDYRENGLKYDY